MGVFLLLRCAKADGDGGVVGYFRNLNQIQFASSIILDIIYADNS